MSAVGQQQPTLERPVPDVPKVQVPQPDRRERRLQSFQPAWRRYIAGLTACAPELEDLADSFPALLFALVSDYGDQRRRAKACALLTEGRSLREAAEALGLPYWLRRLPAGAFKVSLPLLPDGADFAHRIVNFLPREGRDVSHWLATVATAHRAAGPEYAVWLARQLRLAHLNDDAAVLLGAWAWFSQHPGHLGHSLLRRRWCPEMSLRRASEEMTLWRRRLRLVDALGLGLQDCWLADGSAGGFEFVALRTVTDFLSESEAMENCLDQYADQLRAGRTVIFSIRRGARRIACLEIGLHEEEMTMPAIVQLRAARNRRAAPDVWQATFAWLGSQRLSPRAPHGRQPTADRSALARQQLWQPYLEHLTGTPLEAAVRRAAYLPQPRSSRARGPRPARAPSAPPSPVATSA